MEKWLTIDEHMDTFIALLDFSATVFLIITGREFLKNRQQEINLERSLKNSEQLFFELKSLKNTVGEMLSESVNIREVKTFTDEEIHWKEYHEAPVYTFLGALKPYQQVQVMYDRLSKFLPKIIVHQDEIDTILTFNTFPEFEQQSKKLAERLQAWHDVKTGSDKSILDRFVLLKKEHQESAPADFLESQLKKFKNLNGNFFDEKYALAGINSAIDEYMKTIKTVTVGRTK